MPNEKLRPTRFAHLDGHTDICYSYDGSSVLTCGLDGDIRIFQGLDDDNCVTHSVAEQIHCIAFRNDSIIAGTNLNLVQSYTKDEGKPNGIITRCTAFPTHIDISKDKKLIAVASSDMIVKVHDTENFRELIFSGHEAPVLSVALDPKKDFIATSACDGTVRVWNFRTQSLVRSFALVPKSNDFSFSTTLCRLCWSIEGDHLFVPVKSEIQVYNRNTWKVDFCLTDPSITGVASITTISPCGKYIALACRDGRLAVWDLQKRRCLITEKSSKGMAITGLAWHPGGKEELAFVNSGGEFGTMVHFLQDGGVSSSSGAAKETTTTDKDTTEDGDPASLFPPPGDLEDEDDGEFSIAKIKSQLGFADDEEGTFLGLPKNEGGADSVSTSRPESRTDTPLPTATTLVAPKLPEPQKPFQPGMSPEHLNDRYMLWNNTGIVRQYQSEDEHSIEVEFHDSSVHHPLHLNNHLGHSMAALNSEALALAGESQEDQLSKLVVQHFSAWDGSKEWQTEMPEGEDILALGIGIGWVAVATDYRNLRVFTTTGVQRDVISLPGPVVCLAGFEKNIMVVFHSGMGVGGEQSMSAMVFSTCGRKHPTPTPIAVPLSPKSFLAWAGFSDEATPVIVDSAGVVRVLNKVAGQNWTPVLSTKAHAKGKSDHYFVLGASELQGVVRCVLCKGARYPPVLPRPHVTLLNLKIPLCEGESEKSILEEKMIRTQLLTTTVASLAKDGFDMDVPKRETEKTLKETMVKLFALACRADRESRGVEVCELMPSADMVGVAVKYAAKLYRMQLAERLNDVLQKKVEKSSEEEEEEQREHSSYRRRRRESDFEDVYEDGVASQQSTSLVDTEERESREELIKRNPLLAASCKQGSNTREGLLDRSSSITPSNRNPFRRTSAASGTTKGMQMLDSIKVQKEAKGSPVLRPFMKKNKLKQSSLTPSVIAPPAQDTGKENKTDNTVTEVTTSDKGVAMVTPVAKKTSALKLWLEDNKEVVREKFPNTTEMELLVKSAVLFKDVEDSIKQKYKALAAELSQPKEPEKKSVEEKKRKPEQSRTDQPVEKKIKASFGSKLAGFAFTKNSES